MSAGGLVTLERADAVATIRLNDPERRNALSPELVLELIDVLASVDRDESVRCAILTGAGLAFSAGGNPKRMLQPGLYPDMSMSELEAFYRDGIQRLPLAVQALEVPIIAAVNGAAIGAGLDLACACDLRMCSDAAFFASSFIKLGLVSGDGGAWLLPRAVGLANAAELILTGDRIDAERAREMGLVSKVVPAEALEAEALALALRIAANPPQTLRMNKALLARSASATLPEALALAREVQARAHKTDDHREAVMAFLEKRTPVFRGR
jgi:enoyl-CoA hydratase/carnithine racemase